MKKIAILTCLVIASTVLFAQQTKDTPEKDTASLTQQLSSADTKARAKARKEREKMCQAYRESSAPKKVSIGGVEYKINKVKDTYPERGKKTLVEFAQNIYANSADSVDRFTIREYETNKKGEEWSTCLDFAYKNEIIAPYAKKEVSALNKPYKSYIEKNPMSYHDACLLDLEQFTGYLHFIDENNAVYAFYYPESGEFYVIRLAFEDMPGLKPDIVSSYVYEKHFSKAEREKEQALKATRQGLIREIEHMPLPCTLYGSYSADI